MVLLKFCPLKGFIIRAIMIWQYRRIYTLNLYLNLNMPSKNNVQMVGEIVILKKYFSYEFGIENLIA